MKTTKTLHPDSIKKILDSVSVIASDIDDTIVDAHIGLTAGVEKLGEHLGKDLADTIYAMRQLTVEGFRKLPHVPWKKRGAFNALMNEVAALQKSFTGKWGPKVWSRETWITLAAKKLGLALTPHEVERARNIYWQAHTNAARLYDDAQPFFTYIKEKNIPLILMTASNSILRATKKGLHYDPKYSSAYKKKNIDKFGIPYVKMLIGDPVDKPHPAFFDRVEESIKEALGKKPQPHHILAIGDSEFNDLAEPKKRGWKTLLVKR